MRRLEAVPDGDGWRYTLDGERVQPKTAEDLSAPFPGIWVDGQRLYDIEWTIEGRTRAVIPPRSQETEAVYDAYDTGDWSSIPTPVPSKPIALLETAQRAVRDSPGWQAVVRWSHVSRIVTITHSNARDLLGSIDMIERHAAPFERLSDKQHNELDQRTYNLAASLDSIRDQLHKGGALKAYPDTDLRRDVRSRTTELWKLPVMAFLQGLRNALVHESQQGVGLDTIIGTPTRRIVTIYPSRLLDVNVRTFEEAGKTYAREHEKVPLRDLLNEAMTSVVAFNSWLEARVNEHHTDDFSRLQSLLAERDEAERRVHAQPLAHVVDASFEGITLSTPPPDVPRRPEPHR